MKSERIPIDTIKVENVDGRLSVVLYIPDNAYQRLVSVQNAYCEAAEAKRVVSATFTIEFDLGEPTDEPQEIKVVPVEIGEGIAESQIYG